MCLSGEATYLSCSLCFVLPLDEHIPVESYRVSFVLWSQILHCLIPRYLIAMVAIFLSVIISDNPSISPAVRVKSPPVAIVVLYTFNSTELTTFLALHEFSSIFPPAWQLPLPRWVHLCIRFSKWQMLHTKMAPLKTIASSTSQNAIFRNFQTPLLLLKVFNEVCLDLQASFFCRTRCRDDKTSTPIWVMKRVKHPCAFHPIAHIPPCDSLSDCQ